MVTLLGTQVVVLGRNGNPLHQVLHLLLETTDYSVRNVGHFDGPVVSSLRAAFLFSAIVYPSAYLGREVSWRFSSDLSCKIKNGLLGEGFFHAFLCRHHRCVNRAMAV